MIEYVIIHHSATKDGTTRNWDAIRKYHIEHNGWQDIGYHFGVELVDGSYHIVRGRQPGTIGAHCRGYNDKSLGICIVGNFSLDTVPPEQFGLAVRLVRAIQIVFNVPSIGVLGHREAKGQSTECPGLNFDMDLFRWSL